MLKICLIILIINNKLLIIILSNNKYLYTSCSVFEILNVVFLFIPEKETLI